LTQKNRLASGLKDVRFLANCREPVLRSLKDILSSLSSGNHAEEMRQTNSEIDKFLIER
jgi:hypothetical protein